MRERAELENDVTSSSELPRQAAAVGERPGAVLPDWIGLVARAAVAIAVAIFITFSADHSATLGYRMFAIFAIVSGLVVLAIALRSPDSAGRRPWFAAQGIVGVVAGALAAFSTDAGVPFLLFLVSGWAAITGCIELVTGLRARGRVAQAKDWIFAGALTAAFAIVVLLIPAGYREAYIGPDEVERFLTASVILVGGLGAYCAILGVFIAIAAFSLRWPTQKPQTAVDVASAAPESETRP